VKYATLTLFTDFTPQNKATTPEIRLNTRHFTEQLISRKSQTINADDEYHKLIIKDDQYYADNGSQVISYALQKSNIFSLKRESVNRHNKQTIFESTSNHYYPVIVKYNGKYIQKKLETGWWDKPGDHWWAHIGQDWWHVDKLLKSFKDDVLYFQLDENGILQIFHSKPSKNGPDGPTRRLSGATETTFTGDVYDLNFDTPRKIFLHVV
jgi:hypothetical protein